MSVETASPGKARFCQYCIEITKIRQGGHTTRSFYNVWSQFLSRNEQCDVCAYLEDHLRDMTDACPWEETVLNLRVKEPHASPGNVMWALLEVSIRFPNAGMVKRRSRTFSITTWPLDPLGIQTTTCLPAASIEEKIATIKQWLQECKVKHGDNCGSSSTHLPARLIDVGKAGQAPKLVLTAGMSAQSTIYTTLSHCWGGMLPLRTLLSNADELARNIPESLIPRTFQDAIAITRALGVSYLWIDALCIIQDCSDDWSREAVKMKHIYSGSALNIAASDARTGRAGCFGGESDAQTFIIEHCNARDLLVRLQPNDSRDMTLRTTLSSRGWVLQEQLLSPRLVSCMAAEIHWRCAKVLASSTGVRFTQIPIHLQSVRGISQDANPRQWHGEWRRWMSDYSQRDFTFWQDRLAALLGILQFYQEITEDFPLLGLWQKSFLDDLLWIRLAPTASDSMHCLRGYNLPSWSWLSCPGIVEWDIWQITKTTTGEDRFVVDEDFCHLIEHQIAWQGIPFASAITSASLVLAGPTINAIISPDCTAQQTNPPSFKVQILNCPISCKGQFDNGEVHHGQYTCLLLRRRSHKETDAERHIFLILQALSEAEEYHRVGIGCAFESLLFERAVTRTLVVR